MASTKITYIVDPIYKGTSTISIKNTLGYSYLAEIGVIKTYKNYKTDSDYINARAYWFYNYSFSGTWPNITLTLDGQIVCYFGETAANPTTRVCWAEVGILGTSESRDLTNTITWTQEKDCLFISNAYSTTDGDSSYGYWWVLTPFKGEPSKTLALDTSQSSQKKPEFTGKIVAALQSTPNLNVKLSGSSTNFEERSVEVTFPYPEPTMTLSASNVSQESATINIKSHTNPLSYWRYEAQWKISTESTWSSGSVFDLTATTITKTLSNLTPGATYNYRIAYVDRNNNVVSYSSTINFTVPADQATVYINYGGTVKKAKVWYNNGGTIKKVKNIYYNNSGTIKQVKK